MDENEDSQPAHQLDKPIADAVDVSQEWLTRLNEAAPESGPLHSVICPGCGDPTGTDANGGVPGTAHAQLGLGAGVLFSFWDLFDKKIKWGDWKTGRYAPFDRRRVAEEEVTPPPPKPEGGDPGPKNLCTRSLWKLFGRHIVPTGPIRLVGIRVHWGEQKTAMKIEHRASGGSQYAADHDPWFVPLKVWYVYRFTAMTIDVYYAPCGDGTNCYYLEWNDGKVEFDDGWYIVWCRLSILEKIYEEGELWDDGDRAEDVPPEMLGSDDWKEMTAADSNPQFQEDKDEALAGSPRIFGGRSREARKVAGDIRAWEQESDERKARPAPDRYRRARLVGSRQTAGRVGRGN